MTDKQRELLKKLQALAERGVGGEKETAERKLKQLIKKNGIEEAELSEDKIMEFEFKYHNKWEMQLLRHYFIGCLAWNTEKKPIHTDSARVASPYMELPAPRQRACNYRLNMTSTRLCMRKRWNYFRVHLFKNTAYLIRMAAQMIQS